MHFEDIMLEKSYTPVKSYCQSKLANILFTKELARRLEGNWYESSSRYFSDAFEIRNGCNMLRCTSWCSTDRTRSSYKGHNKRNDRRIFPLVWSIFFQDSRARSSDNNLLRY